MDISKQITRMTTEGRNQKTTALDTLSAFEIVQLINQEDQTVAQSVSQVLPQIAAAVDLIVTGLQNGGRLFYVGAGTSGRLGVLDAAEAPPTFGVDYELIQAVMAGGREAMFQAAENSEDNLTQGATDLEKLQINARDVVVGIAASGRTPYVIGAMQGARKAGAKTVALVCNKEAEMSQFADISIAVVVGSEVLTGSTRMKAGTAQKMVLNMLSTAAMVRTGRVYQNLMVDMRPTNEKLVERAVQIITTVTAVDPETARRLLAESGNQIKTAIVMAEGNIGRDEAAALLAECQGWVREAIGRLKQPG